MSEILLVGATGLVGNAVAEASDRHSLIILSRRAPPVPWSIHHRTIIQPSKLWTGTIAHERPDVLISCLGTTIKQAGSRAAFHAVDHDLVLAVARAVRAAGTRHMICVSSVGASARSRNFYLATKGRVEDALRALGFDRLDIIRPGLLTGDRQGSARLGESLAMLAAPFTDLLLHGGMRRYRSTPATAVARTILALAAQGGTGTAIHENVRIAALAD